MNTFMEGTKLYSMQWQRELKPLKLNNKKIQKLKTNSAIAANSLSWHAVASIECEAKKKNV